MTVAQYQDLNRIYKSEGSDIEKSAEAISLFYGIPQKEVDDMSMDEFRPKAAEIYRQYEQAVKNPAPCTILKAGTREYQVNYNLATFRSAQYTEVQGWLAGDLIDNMDKIMASISNPIIKRWYGKAVGKNRSEDHAQVCEDMRQADFRDVYGGVVFFCKVFSDSINAILSYLGSSKMSRQEKQKLSALQTALRQTLDGFTTQNLWPTSAQ